MGIKSHIGNKKVGLVTFSILLLVTILTFLLYQAFFVYRDVSNEEKIPIKNIHSLTDDDNVNVTVQRYYNLLNLLEDEDGGDYLYQLNETNKNHENRGVKEDVAEIVVEKENSVVETKMPVVGHIEEKEEKEEKEEFVEETESLFDDSGWDDWDDVSELLPPILFDPLVQTQEEYDMFNPDVSPVSDYNDDFFSDFYVAGEGESTLFPDGFYYLKLIVNDEELGEIEVEFRDESYYLNAQELYDFVYNRLSDSAIDRIFGDVEDYISIDELIEKGVDASIDIDAFTVTLYFSLEDMPLTIIPVSDVRNLSALLKNNQYGISDAEIVEPEFVTLVSAVNLYGNHSYGPANSDIDTFTLNLYMNNSLSIGDIEFNFANNFAYTFGDVDEHLVYDFGSWSGAHSYYNKNLKLTFGQVGGSLISVGTPIGFTLEKTYSYGIERALPHQFSRQFVIDDIATINIYLNDEIILSRRLKQGEYRFIDFSFQDGANLLVFDINYDDDQYEDIIEQYNIAYDSGLLARGDYLYGLSGAIHKTIIDDTAESLLTLPYPDGSWYEYNLSAFEMTYWINVGLTDSFTLNTSLSMAPEVMQLTFEGLLATLHGPYNGTLDVGLEDSVTPSLDLSLSHTFATSFGPISTSLSLTAPEFARPSYELTTDGSIGVSLGYTFNLWRFPPLSTSFNMTASNSSFITSSSIGMSYSPASGLSLSTSLSVVTSTISDTVFTFSAGLSYSLLQNFSTSSSFSGNITEDGDVDVDSSLSASYNVGDNDALQFSISNIQYTFESEDDDIVKPSYSSTWSHTGKVSTSSLRQSVAITDDEMDYNTNASISTTLYYAGGLFGIDGGTSSNFLLLRPRGKLAGSSISISKTNNSTPSLLNSVFGTYVYTDLSANLKNNILVYGETNSIFSSGGTFSYELNTNSRTGFTQRMSIPLAFTISGVLYDADGIPYSQYSSPVYSREVDENGNYYLQISENLYLFTDANGRYIFNDVPPGFYVFDLQVDKNWYAIAFEVPSNDDYDGMVLELEDYQVENLDQEIIGWDLPIETENTDNTAEDFLVDTFGQEIVSDYNNFDFIEIGEVVDEATFSENSQQEFAPSGFDEATGGDEFVESEVDPFADTASSWVDEGDNFF